MITDTNENEDCPSCGEALGVNDLEETVCLNTECDQFGIPVEDEIEPDAEEISNYSEPDFEIIDDEDIL